MKKETLEAKRSGRGFGEVNRIFDDYRFPITPPEDEQSADEPSVAEPQEAELQETEVEQ
jgi:hypothetical protein